MLTLNLLIPSFCFSFQIRCKKKSHVPIKPTTGFVAKVVRKFYTDLSSVANNGPQFEKAVKLASRCYNDIDNLRDPALFPSKKTRSSGAGRKPKTPEIREALFSWFIDVRETLKGRLPRRLFKLKAQQLYTDWLAQNLVPV